VFYREGVEKLSGEAFGLTIREKVLLGEINPQLIVARRV